MRESVAPFMSFFSGPFEELNRQPDVANFAVGNPQEMPLPAYVAALRDATEPQDKDWFAYKLSEAASQRTVAATLTARTGMEWDPDDVAMTNGGFAAIAVALRTLVEPADEVVFLSPPWFFYEMLILAAGGEPVRVRLEPPTFDLDLEHIADAIGPRTRAIMLNSPHNPSGRVYPAADLRALAGALTDASARIGHPIWIISDEPYNRILFDGRRFDSPSQVYPHTVITYSYGKTLLAPGQRIGYLTVPPTLPAPGFPRIPGYEVEAVLGHGGMGVVYRALFAFCSARVRAVCGASWTIRVVKVRLTKSALRPETGWVRTTGCSASGNCLPSSFTP